MNVTQTFSFAVLTVLGFVVSFQGGRHVERVDRQAEVEALTERIAVIEAEVERLSSKYEVLYAVVQCESSGRHEGNWGDLDYYHPAYGVTQIQQRTFYWLAEKANLQGAEWKNQEHQLKLLSWGIDNDYGPLWTCYRKLSKGEESGRNS